ncbi:MAG: caspase family protein, partial [Treponema sp.]|nr:caspase family protein [Treponema sp.]
MIKLKVNVFVTTLYFFTAAALAFGAQEEDSTRRFGIFIGSNNGGRDRTMLRYAISDARSVSKVFSEMGGISVEDTVLLVEPSIRDINSRIDALHEQVIRSKRINKRTEIVFYYSGHSDEDGLLLNREKYPYRELRDRINRIPSDMRIVILDSCASGAFTRLKGGSKTQPFLMDSSISAEGYAFLTSSSATESSQESDRIAASYFTHSLVAGLRGAADSVGDGRVTLNELYRFTYAETLARTETSAYGAQHPSYDIQVSGTGDLVLTDVKETSAGIVFDEKLTGRLSIRDSSGYLIAELNKTAARPLELGLEPGFYRVTLQQGNDLLRTELNLSSGRRFLVMQKDFTFIGAEPARSRGGESHEPSNKNDLYTFIFNNVSENFRFPLIGLINIARGDHDVAQVGLMNMNTGNFNGLQASFLNTVDNNFTGVQAGYVNTAIGNTKGLQASFVNTVGADLIGAQAGFINSVANETTGAQLGFVNTAANEMKGSQIGFVNTVANEMKGAQLGFVNTVIKESSGLQAGIVNIATRKFKGVQLGFVNYADSIENGIPVGFLSIVRNGYHAVEYSVSEFYPVNAGLKLGVDKFYTSIFVGYNPSREWEFGKGHSESYSESRFATGMGIGSILPINSFLFYNPELNVLSSWDSRGVTLDSITNYQSLVQYLGFKFGQYLSIAAGPSFTWIQNNIASSQEPLF